MRCNLCDRILDRLNPTLRVALRIASIVERQDFVLEQRVDSGCVELVLLLLILEGALVGQSPSSTLAIALEPPTVEHREVDNTVHQRLLA